MLLALEVLGSIPSASTKVVAVIHTFIEMGYCSHELLFAMTPIHILTRVFELEKGI